MLFFFSRSCEGRARRGCAGLGSDTLGSVAYTEEEDEVGAGCGWLCRLRRRSTGRQGTVRLRSALRGEAVLIEARLIKEETLMVMTKMKQTNICIRSIGRKRNIRRRTSGWSHTRLGETRIGFMRRKKKTQKKKKKHTKKTAKQHKNTTCRSKTLCDQPNHAKNVQADE